MRRFKIPTILILLSMSVLCFGLTIECESGSKGNVIELNINSVRSTDPNTFRFKVISKPAWISEIFPNVHFITNISDLSECGCHRYEVDVVFGRYTEDLEIPVEFEFSVKPGVTEGTEGYLIINVEDLSGRNRDIQIRIVVGKDNGDEEEPVTDNKDDTITSYPNPARVVDGKGEITFKNVKEGSVIKIYNIKGEKVKEIKVQKGMKYAKWYMKNKGGKLVSSGVYIYTIETPDGKYYKNKIIILK